MTQANFDVVSREAFEAVVGGVEKKLQAANRDLRQAESDNEALRQHNADMDEIIESLKFENWLLSFGVGGALIIGLFLGWAVGKWL